MSDSNDTSAIDEKNQELNSSNQSNYISNIGSFVFNVFILFIIIGVYYASSGLVLYACKLSQSNILPTDNKCFPYEDTKPNIQPININIFNTLFSDPPMSNKIKFPYNEYNSSNKILDMFRDYKNKPNSNFLANYFISIIESVILFNYTTFNFILNILNELPEFLIVLFGPILIGIITAIVLLCDQIYLIYLWFANMGWFFKTNMNDTGTGRPKWSEVTLIDWFGYWSGVWLVILFAVLFIITFPFVGLPFLLLVANFSIFWCMFSSIMYTAEMNGKSITSAAVIQDIFKYYKSLIVGIFCLLVIVSAFSKLGTVPGVFSIITLALIYFGIISIDMFSPINKEHLSPLTSYKQAKKTCNDKKNVDEKHGLLYDLVFGQKGGSISKELKNLGKKLSRK